MPSLGDVAAALTVGLGSAVLAPVRPGPGPATGRWGVGVGEFAASRVPGPLRGLARQLNQLGSVVVDPAGIEYDGDDVAWSAVTEIRARRLVGYLVTEAVAKQVRRTPMGVILGRIPGRGIVLNGLSQTGLTAMALVTGMRLDAGIATLYLPAEVHYRRLVRSRQMTAGIPAALVLADPAVCELVETTAAAHGVPMLMADDDALEAAVGRAASIRRACGRAVGLLGVLAGQAGTRSSA